MARVDDAGGMRIGEVLKTARRRRELDIRTVEERTKIRIKYLRALESEDWDALPSSAYAKGFLRTYADLLGLDGEAIVDEYRRQVETDVPEEHRYPLGEPLLEGRRRPGGEGGPRLPTAGVIGAVLAAIVILVGVLAITGDDEGGGDRAAKRARQARQDRQQERRQERRQERQAAQAQGERVALRLEINSAVPVCLIGDGRQPLIDDQLLSPGAVEGPYQARRFELRFPSGYDRDQLDLFVAGRRERLPELTGPAAFRIEPAGRVSPSEAPSGVCP